MYIFLKLNTNITDITLNVHAEIVYIYTHEIV